ncbi:MAG: hypothetical protein ACTSRU_20210, partial [Candidatus Hodarchaeales archaeon]
FEEMTVGDSVSITSDPRYFVCMSLLGNSWTSCMSLISTHSYKKGVIFWHYLKGASIAIIWGSKFRTIAGIRLREIGARCLIYKTQEGNKCYGKVYPGENSQSKELIRRLRNLNFESMDDHKGEIVEGRVRIGLSPLPYFDRSSNQYKIKVNNKSYRKVKL